MPRIFDNVELELLPNADETGLRRLSAQLKAGKVRTADGNDALAWVDEQGHTVTKSQHDILRAAACKPTTTLRPRLTNLHAPVLGAITGIILINGVPFVQIYIINNRDSTYDVANKNARHIAFNADDLVNNARLSAGEIELSLVA